MVSIAKILLKNSIKALAIVLVYPLIFLSRITGYNEMSQFISLIPFNLGKMVRYYYYRKTLAACGENVVFHFGVIISYPEVRIGNNVRLGPYNTLGYVSIGDNVLTGQYCHLLSGSQQHLINRLDIPIMEQGSKLRMIAIGNDVWLGANSVIMNDVGNGCVVGASSVVTKPISDYEVAVGNPAKIIKRRNQKL